MFKPDSFSQRNAQLLEPSRVQSESPRKKQLLGPHPAGRFAGSLAIARHTGLRPFHAQSSLGDHACRQDNKKPSAR